MSVLTFDEWQKNWSVKISEIQSMNPIIRNSINAQLLTLLHDSINEIHCDKCKLNINHRSQKQWIRASLQSLQSQQRKLLRLKQKRESNALLTNDWIKTLKTYLNDCQLANEMSQSQMSFAKRLYNQTLIHNSLDDEKQSHNLIFLDVDGVINDALLPQYLPFSHLQRLKRIIDSQSNIRIIVSSSWRETQRSLFELLIHCHCVGIDCKRVFIGCAPINIRENVTRSDEIRQWFDAMKVSETKLIISDYVILDDLSLSGDCIDSHFVRTDIRTGLNDNNVETIIKRFQSSQK